MKLPSSADVSAAVTSALTAAAAAAASEAAAAAAAQQQQLAAAAYSQLLLPILQHHLLLLLHMMQHLLLLLPQLPQLPLQTERLLDTPRPCSRRLQILLSGCCTSDSAQGYNQLACNLSDWLWRSTWSLAPALRPLTLASLPNLTSKSPRAVQQAVLAYENYILFTMPRRKPSSSPRSEAAGLPQPT